MPPAGLVNGKAHNEYLQSVICHFSSHSSLRRERPLSLKALNDIGYSCTLQPRTFACPHCAKPIEVDSVLDALVPSEVLSRYSASDLARAMREKR
jgi:hypothetical protein